MFELDSRGIQFPGHDPARTACSFACLFPGIFALYCLTVEPVLISLYALGIPYMKGAPSNRSPAACKSQTLLCTAPGAVASWFDIGQNTGGTSAHVWHMN